MLHEIKLRSSKRDEMIDITGPVQRIVTQEAVQEGLAVVYAAHTTAGITINENAGPNVTRDLLRRLDGIWQLIGPKKGTVPKLLALIVVPKLLVWCARLLT